MTGATPSATRVVLVVEDDPLVRMSAVDIVEDADFVAYEARNADQALRMLEAHPEISVLFTDIDMPGTMDGLALAHAVRQRWPHMTIIIASGHVRIEKGDMPDDGVFFPKPYASSTIRRALERAAPRRH
ncbi:MAG: hypothetical protein DI534_15730 [Leifsonia xyli]|nr:MAG: hypothetical protein DI534_15730 [Leifsonia xyli]